MSPKTPTLMLLACLLPGCAEFAEEGSEALRTAANPDATWEQTSEEAVEAIASLKPGEQHEGEIDLKLRELDQLLLDFEVQVERARDPSFADELRQLEQVAIDARTELDALAEDSSEAAGDLGRRIDDAIDRTKQNLEALTDDS